MPDSLINVDEAYRYFVLACVRIREVFAGAIEFALNDGLDVDRFDAGPNWKVYQLRAEDAAKVGDFYRTVLRCDAWEKKVRGDLRFWVTEERRRIGRPAVEQSKAA